MVYHYICCHFPPHTHWYIQTAATANFRGYKTVLPVLQFVHPCMYIPHQRSLTSTGYLSMLVTHIKLPASVSVALTPLLLLISDTLHLYFSSQPLCSSADTHLLKLPLYKYKTKGGRAFSHSGPSVWNSLPPHIRTAATITTFKSAPKTHFFSLYHSD